MGLVHLDKQSADTITDLVPTTVYRRNLDSDDDLVLGNLSGEILEILLYRTDRIRGSTQESRQAERYLKRLNGNFTSSGDLFDLTAFAKDYGMEKFEEDLRCKRIILKSDEMGRFIGYFLTDLVNYSESFRANATEEYYQHDNLVVMLRSKSDGSGHGVWGKSNLQVT